MQFWRAIVLLGWALYFGGFTVYAGFVVPIGADVLGSDRAQGFITREVTQVLNVLGAAALLLLAVDALVRRTRERARFALATLGLAVLCQALLFVLHPWMDALLDPTERAVREPAAFYTRHRYYLWAAGFLWLFMLHQLWDQARPTPRRSS